MNMRAIKSLAYKDICLLGKQLRFIAIYMVVFSAIFAITMDNAASVTSFLSVVMFFISINCFAYDEMAGFDKMAAAAPVKKRDVVLARYAASHGLGFGGALLMSVIGYLVSVFSPAAERASLLDALTILLVVVAGGSLMISITFPLIYKFGTNKSRVIMLLMCAIPAALVGAMSSLLPDSGQFSRLAAALLRILPFALLIVAVVAAVVSVSISSRILSKKEY